MRKAARKLRQYRGPLLGIAAILICVAAFLFYNNRQNQTFGETVYRVFSDKIDEPVRAVFLTDLHQVSFGEGNAELIDGVRRLEPDLILIGGDMVNDQDTDLDVVLELCRGLVEIAPVYYGMGNHENVAVYGMNLYKEELEAAGVAAGEEGDFSQLIKDDTLLRGLEECGVTVLQNTSEQIKVNGNTLLIGGISTSVDGFWPYSGHFFTEFDDEGGDVYKILLSHFPSTVSRYLYDCSVDLALSGHNHGGIVRIPGIGGLISYDEGWFPENDAGKRQIGDTTLIISRGLGNHGRIPRICNRPELVVIDLF